MDERLPLVFIDREGKPGGGEGIAYLKESDLHPERTETALDDVGGDG